MNRRLRSVGTILLGLAAVASSVQFPISAKATVSVDCKNFDAYKVGASVRHSCGVRDYPLDHIASLPGGGKEYVYFIDGHKTTYRIPPAGFSFVTATSDQLAEYNLPARPANPTEGARWFESMSKLHLVAPPPFLVTLPRSASSYSQIWSGYVTTGGGYWLAKGYWNEISQGSSCSGSTA